MGANPQLDSEILAEPEIQYRPLPYTPFRQPTFTSKSKYKKWQTFKLILGAVILVPIRIIGLLISVSCAIAAAYLYLKGQPRQVYGHKPDVKEGHWLVVIINRCVRLGLFFLGLTSIEFRGKIPVDYDQDRPWCAHSIVAAPHSATFDWALVCARATRGFSPVIKKSTGEAAAVRRLVRMTMPIIVDRSSKESRVNAAKDIMTRMTQGFKAGYLPVLGFPEGTNGNRQQLLKFKAGMFLSGEPVIPVLLSYPENEQKDENDLQTWPHFGRSVPLTILLCMCRLKTTLVYTFLSPYYPTEEEKKNPPLYAENVRQLMSKELKKPTAEWTFEDAKLMRQCQRAKVQPEIGAIKVEKIYAGFKNGEKQASELLASYIKVVQKYAKRVVNDEFQDAQQNMKGLLPVVNKKVLLGELYGAETPEIFERRLPNYVSFEQLALVHAKHLTQKVQ